MASCHDDQTPVPQPAQPLVGHTVMLGNFPRAAVVLAIGLGLVGLISVAWIAISPLSATAFGGLTVPVILTSGFADGLNPCAFALLVLFATYTLTFANSVTSDGSATLVARRRLLGAGSLYVGAVWITYFIIGLGFLSFLGWLGQDHLVARIAAIIALGMAMWMLKDVFLPGVGPSMMAPAGTHGRMHKAIERGGLAGMLIAGVLVGICTVPCSGAVYLAVIAVLTASGGGLTGLALLALYNLAFITPLVLLLLAVSNRRVLGQMARANRANSGWVKAGLAIAVVLMAFGLLYTLG